MEEKKFHPLVTEAQEALRKGNITRRDFLRISTLVGLSLASANFLAACSQPTAAPTTAPVVEPTAAPTVAPKPSVVRGGTLTVAT